MPGLIRGWFGYVSLSLFGALFGIACSAQSPATAEPAASGAGGAASGAANSDSAGSPASLGGSGAGGMGVAGAPASGSAGEAAGSAGLGTVSGLGGAGPVAPKFPFPALIDGCDVPAAQANADAALGATLASFWSGVDQYLRATSPANGKAAASGSYAQILDAVLDGVERTGGQRFFGLVRALYEGQAAHGFSSDDYGDEAWLTLALLRAYDLTADARYLTTAQTLYEGLMTQWDTTCCGSHSGGLWANKSKTFKTASANAGAALSGVRLAQRTGKNTYLEFAQKAYAFWWSELVDQPTFAVYDQLNADGSRGNGALTDDHGLMMAVALELNAQTGQAHYLSEANGYAGYLIAHGTRTSSAGPLLDDGSPCAGTCAAWKGVGYRYLAEIYRHDPTRADFRNVLVSGATAVWTLARDTNKNFFNAVWAGPAPASGSVEAQGSATMALNLYAMLCGSDPKAANPEAGVYEAEEGFLDHVDFEATKGKLFKGLGYVSAFTRDKQGVSIDVKVPKAGMYSLAWRYTAGEGAGSRVVVVNGVTQAKAMAFPATPNWTSWTNVQSSAQLPAGMNTVGLYFDASKGSKTSLDIDELIVTAL